MSKQSKTIPQRSDARRAAELAELLLLRRLLADIWQRRASVN